MPYITQKKLIMSKKTLLSSALMLLALGLNAQTIVSTTTENRNVVLEEFTGIYCTFCPDGHAIAQALKDANPENVFLVNNHTGGYAAPTGGDPDFRTPYGAAIANQSGLAGYPAGTVNRENFPGLEQGNAGTTAMSRNFWGTAANTVMAESSYANIAVEADVDIQTNEMTIHVETYYTGDSPEDTNKLNIFILQNNTTGPQTGGGAGDNYVHQHRLIDMPLGQWGQDINNTTSGSFDDTTVVYPIPVDHNGILVELADLEVVVAVTEGNQYIISGDGVIPSFSGLDATNDANLRTLEEVGPQCATEIAPKINIQNLGEDTINSLDIAYSVNGEADAMYTYTGELTSLQSVNIELPSIAYTAQDTNTLVVTIENDDENNANNSLSTTFDTATTGAGNVILTVETDNFASQNNWSIRNSSGTAVAAGSLSGNNNTTVEFNIELDTEDCYTLLFNDNNADGITGGGVSLEDINGVVHLPLTGDFGSGLELQFGADGILGADELTFEGLSIYPNPAKGYFNIVNAENADVTVYDIQGRKVRSVKKISQNEQVDTNRIQTGTYFVTITREGSTTTEKLIIK
ncbi:hypothetical protein SCB49_04120 [unidentified eubacterium SCB49]|nr:hypothetical protein SCB49_04120 [unidentified eubacterium SCB49]